MTTPVPASTPWVPMWSLQGGVAINYLGGWAPGTYQPGQIVVDNGVEYMCVRQTTKRPTPWAASQAASYGTSLPASPIDGQEAVLVDSLTSPTYQWRFRYNANSTSLYKWEFVGGAPIYIYASDAPAVASGWAIVATPQVTPPRPGVYLIQAQCRYLQIPTAGFQMHVSGGSSVDGSGVESTFFSPSIANQVTPMQPSLVQRTLLAGQTACIWVYNGCPTAGTIGSRALTVTPVRV